MNSSIQWHSSIRLGNKRRIALIVYEKWLFVYGRKLADGQTDGYCTEITVLTRLKRQEQCSKGTEWQAIASLVNKLEPSQGFEAQISAVIAAYCTQHHKIVRNTALHPPTTSRCTNLVFQKGYRTCTLRSTCTSGKKYSFYTLVIVCKAGLLLDGPASSRP